MNATLEDRAFDAGQEVIRVIAGHILEQLDICNVGFMLQLREAPWWSV